VERADIVVLGLTSGHRTSVAAVPNGPLSAPLARARSLAAAADQGMSLLDTDAITAGEGC
jgi:hypothetical protein